MVSLGSFSIPKKDTFPMALPAVLVLKIIPILLAVGKFLHALFTVAEHFFRALWVWFYAHKIIFSLFLLACWVSLWYGLVSLFGWIGQKFVSELVYRQFPEIQDLLDGFGFIGSFISYRALRGFLSVVAAMSTSELIIRNSMWAWAQAVGFIHKTANLFRA